MRDRPASFNSRRRTGVAAAVPLGVRATVSPALAAYLTRSARSGRRIGSPPVSTNSGAGANARTWSISRNPSAVVSSRGSRRAIASARQCTHARAQARVTSQITRKGAWLKSTGPMPAGRISESLAVRLSGAYDRRHRSPTPQVLEWPHGPVPRLAGGADDRPHDSPQSRGIGAHGGHRPALRMLVETRDRRLVAGAALPRDAGRRAGCGARRNHREGQAAL